MDTDFKAFSENTNKKIGNIISHMTDYAYQRDIDSIKSTIVSLVPKVEFKKLQDDVNPVL